jgi:GntR family transcriptional repressor for pyruvate dehydrogenase complex
MPTPAEPLRRANLSSAIAERLRRQIRGGHLAAGVRLPGHRELAAMYSVSVGSVREAISMLVSEGLVTTQAGRGTFVVEHEDAILPPAAILRPLDRVEVAELIEAREILEVEIAGLAAERASPEHVARLDQVVERMAASVRDATTFLESDLELHLTLAEAATNRFLLQAVMSIRSLLRSDMELSAEVGLRRFGDLGFAVDLHRELVNRVRERDVEGARNSIAGIVQENREFVLSLYAQPVDAADAS